MGHLIIDDENVISVKLDCLEDELKIRKNVPTSRSSKQSLIFLKRSMIQELKDATTRCANNIPAILLEFIKNDELRRICQEAADDIHPRFLPFLLEQGLSISHTNEKSVSEKVGLAIELAKASLLVDDDILDHSMFRNNKLSIQAKYGIPMATVVSYELLTAAMLSIMKISELGYKKKNLLIGAVKDALNGVSVGQSLDVSYEKIDFISERSYFEMIEKTTASMIRLPLILSSIISDSDAPVSRALFDYGTFVGIAYQMRDDIIDIIGDQRKTGKMVASDLKMGKKRLPLIILLKTLSEERKSRIIEFLRNRPLAESHVKHLIKLIEEYEVITTSKNMCKAYSDMAIESISSIEDSKGKENLIKAAKLISTF